MADLNGLIRQHVMVHENIRRMKCLIEVSNISRDISNIVEAMEVLTYKLKIQTEVSAFLDYKDIKVRKTINEYINYSGSIKREYERYMKNYNTKKKIMKDVDKFKTESEIICGKLGNMINRETELICGLHKNYISNVDASYI